MGLLVCQMCVLVGLKPTRVVFNDLLKTTPTALYKTLSSIVPAAVPVSGARCPCDAQL